VEAPPEPKPKGLPRAVRRILIRGVIVVVLALLLWPAWRMGRESARRATCLSNMRQLGIGLMGYEDDHDGSYPWRLGVLDPDDGWRDLGMLFPAYVSEADRFFCRSSRDRSSWLEHNFFSRTTGDEPIQSKNPRALISYSYSHDARGGVWGGQQSACVPWAEQAPHTVRLLADKKAGVAMAKRFGHMVLEGKPQGRNVAYADGHVRWKAGDMAIDPDEEDDAIGAPDAADYTDWWSDPPYYGEGTQ
jgi:prepilin-type processing-associated H-X9-DG protein